MPVFVTVTGMDNERLLSGLMTYLCFLPLLVFHEFAHAWVAWKCGDDTARLQGRVSLNPIVHMDFIGTVLLPILALSLAAADSRAAGFIIGWGKPVPVNLSNLRRPRRDDTLVALAGPAMNVMLAMGLVALARLGQLGSWPIVQQIGVRVAMLSLFLCFFNLLPIPPLDGSHVLKNLIRMPPELYWRLCQIGFILVILLWQVAWVKFLVVAATLTTLNWMAAIFGMQS